MDAQKEPSLRCIRRYEKNPFIVKLGDKMYLQPKVDSIIAKGQGIVDLQTGEVLNEKVMIGKRKFVDRTAFTKLYTNELSIVYDLSKTARNLFLMVIERVDYENKFLFSYTREFYKLGYKTKKPALLGLLELIRSNILIPHISKDVYWINPVIVCKGDRFSMYTEYIISDDAEDIIPPEEIYKDQQKRKFKNLNSKLSRQIEKANKIDEEIYRQQDNLNSENYEQEEE